ncbi:MAG: hypothetical protein LDL33_10975 [Desulfomonile sp.]|nr:hypothetical protein [Desulfomonile sp.]
MPSDHKIKARDIINDIRSGMTDTELMEKYEMSPAALQMAFEQLINMKLLKDHELYGRSVSTRESLGLPRHYLVVKVPIRDVKSGVVGTIRDITEKNMGILGIGGTLGEIKTFEIVPEGFDQVHSFLFNAKCRWTKRDEHGDYLSGYEITSISEEGLEQLRKLIGLVTLD